LAEEERKHLADVRRLIFVNLANGVQVPDVMVAYRLSEKEVLDHFRFVSRKIWGYRFERGLPYIRCETPQDAFHQRRALFHSLDRCGDTYLTSDHRLSREQTQEISDTPGVADEMVEYYSQKQTTSPTH
jgi:hypothetical protein